MENSIQTVSTNITNILIELARAAQTAPPIPPPASSIANNSNEILRQLQGISSEIGQLRSHLTARPQIGQDPSSWSTKTLETLMELQYCGHWGTFKPATAEEHNQLARRYNSNLRHTYDCVMPLHNRRNKCVFGFPNTLGELVSLDTTAAELLCGAFDISEPEGEYGFADFCGCDSNEIIGFPCFGPTAGQIASDRMMDHHQRTLDVAAHIPTADTRRHAENHNRVARKHNSAATGYTGIKPLLDERGLVVPGFPTNFEWFSRKPKQDVLWLLGQYGLDTSEEGCMERLKEFVGVEEMIEREGEVEWYL
ncbi:hypothetical protein DFP73DRAFT_561546 [Morchella snyderi]|nr:hypothetical protein DFP73DRAFT_561546 [Morchella snyderi]